MERLSQYDMRAVPLSHHAVLTDCAVLFVAEVCEGRVVELPKRIEGISDIRNESGRAGMRIVVEIKKDANPQVVLNQLYRYTQLQDTVGVIMLALDDGVPKICLLYTSPSPRD